MPTPQVSFLDNRGTIITTMEQMIDQAQGGEIQAVGIVALHTNGDFSVHEATKNHTDRLALVGATQVLAQHIMAGDRE